MAWRWSGDKELSEPMMVSLPTHICVTWPQWVNTRLLSMVTCFKRLHQYIYALTHVHCAMQFDWTQRINTHELGFKITGRGWAWFSQFLSFRFFVDWHRRFLGVTHVKYYWCRAFRKHLQNRKYWRKSTNGASLILVIFIHITQDFFISTDCPIPAAGLLWNVWAIVSRESGAKDKENKTSKIKTCA